MTMAPWAAILGDHSLETVPPARHQHDVRALEVVMLERLDLERCRRRRRLPCPRSARRQAPPLRSREMRVRPERSAFPVRHCRSRRRRRPCTTLLNPFRDRSGKRPRACASITARRCGGKAAEYAAGFASRQLRRAPPAVNARRPPRGRTSSMERANARACRRGRHRSCRYPCRTGPRSRYRACTRSRPSRAKARFPASGDHVAKLAVGRRAADAPRYDRRSRARAGNTNRRRLRPLHRRRDNKQSDESRGSARMDCPPQGNNPLRLARLALR